VDAAGLVARHLADGQLSPWRRDVERRLDLEAVAVGLEYGRQRDKNAF
jgi:hypothetical protein